MQLSTNTTRGRWSWFQSSPALSGRCNRRPEGVVLYRIGFQSSPALSGRCNLTDDYTLARYVEFQSSPALSGRCNRAAVLEAAAEYGFQSSPALSGRCNVTTSSCRNDHPCFNPHRPFRAGATPGAPCSRAQQMGFNPHRPFRAGATGHPPQPCGAATSFNPHRPFRAGATSHAGHIIFTPISVSILTGPFGPVQHSTGEYDTEAVEFQSSPALSGRCNLKHKALESPPPRFNPHRPFRAGATQHHPTCLRALRCFNPHRPFRAGATKDLYDHS